MGSGDPRLSSPRSGRSPEARRRSKRRNSIKNGGGFGGISAEKELRFRRLEKLEEKLNNEKNMNNNDNNDSNSLENGAAADVDGGEDADMEEVSTQDHVNDNNEENKKNNKKKEKKKKDNDDDDDDDDDDDNNDDGKRGAGTPAVNSITSLKLPGDEEEDEEDDVQFHPNGLLSDTGRSLSQPMGDISEYMRK